MERTPNALIHSTSPYLLQHAYNPVQWYPWGPEALQKAQEEQKLLLISIGYSACHWCHVMEHESFEDEEIATVMNKFFVCIKVDREERPDIDQVYMEAVQIMTGRGGWPLNCIALPDQRPVYGGTYFPKEQWRSVLLQLSKLWGEDKARFTGYAEELTDALQRMAIVPADKEHDLAQADIPAMVAEWSKHFDTKEGGPQRSPKFPLPDTYSFLLAHWYYSSDEALRTHIELTLRKMADGGIYDHIGGGFARYSTDALWKVPHFEKMLYDNAQLITLYADAYKAFGDERYREVAKETLDFVLREWSAREAGFYSALDADTEGEEGKFYVWTEKELEQVLGDDAALCRDYFNVNSRGYWEHGNYILLRYDDDAAVAALHGMSVQELRIRIAVIKRKLFTVREQRAKPGLDDKIIVGWNALLLKAGVDAAMAFSDEALLNDILVRAEGLKMKISLSGEKIIHSFSERQSKDVVQTEGFLDDYATLIEAWIRIYEATFEEQWLWQAERWTSTVLTGFQQPESGLFYYTSDRAEALIARKIDLQDNVIPSGNAVMAHNLVKLARLLEKPEWESMATRMVKAVLPLVLQSTPWYARWARVLQLLQQPATELVLTGPDLHRMKTAVHRLFYPDLLLAGSAVESTLPILTNRVVQMENLVYVCRNKSCQLPVSDIAQALPMLDA